MRAQQFCTLPCRQRETIWQLSKLSQESQCSRKGSSKWLLSAVLLFSLMSNTRVLPQLPWVSYHTWGILQWKNLTNQAFVYLLEPFASQHCPDKCHHGIWWFSAAHSWLNSNLELEDSFRTESAEQNRSCCRWQSIDGAAPTQKPLFHCVFRALLELSSATNLSV